MGVSVEHQRPGERIEVRKDRDGTISVWFQDAPLVIGVTRADAIEAVRRHFGNVNPKIVEFLTQ
jgi:hypothetical protein